MKTGIVTILLTALFLPLAVRAETTGGSAQEAPGAAIQITSQQNNWQQRTNVVKLQFNLIDPAVAGSSPSFRIQLDDNAPTTTATTEESLIGVPPGEHSIRVELLDASGDPVPQSHSEVKFSVLPSAATHTSNAHKAQLSKFDTQAAEGTLASDASRDAAIPEASSSLPILSIIGFGVLVGGIASAMKTR